MRAAIERAVLAAAGLATEPRHRATIVCGSGKVVRLRFAPMSAEHARAYLTGLVEDLFGRAHDYLLPCEAVLAAARGNPAALPQLVARLRDSGNWFSSRGGPLRISRQLGPPVDAAELIARRFSPWLDGLEEERGG